MPIPFRPSTQTDVSVGVVPCCMLMLAPESSNKAATGTWRPSQTRGDPRGGFFTPQMLTHGRILHSCTPNLQRPFRMSCVFLPLRTASTPQQGIRGKRDSCTAYCIDIAVEDPFMTHLDCSVHLASHFASPTTPHNALGPPSH